ncbi:MAG: TonB-dependent receptor, partial [Alphaproteobacteria bacterium]|nr:TonB-dependent receptor [Alphaproteobacteria bacterium]
MATRAALLLAALAASVPALAAPAETARRFDIPAGSLDRALAAFALQAGVSIGGADLPARTSRGVRGTMTPQAALERLLRGTGLSAGFVDAKTVRIARLAPPPQPLRPAALPAAAPPEEIMVTATRRSGPASAVPISAAALSASDLFQLGAATSEAALRAVAGVVTTNLGSGRDKIFVRGLSDGAFTGRTETTVSVYLDDARATYSAPDPDLRLVDVERVEVLRGPQSPLYGAGSLGGIYRVVTRAPEAEGWAVAGGATLALTRNGARSWRGEGMLNAPLARDRAALRLVAYRSRDGGYIDDPGRGTNLNATNVVGARAALRWQTEGWTVDLAGALQDIEAKDSQ